MAAPTPRPAKLKLLTGVRPGRDSGGRLVPTPPAFERAAPEPPDWLDSEGSAEWRRIVPVRIRACGLDGLEAYRQPAPLETREEVIRDKNGRAVATKKVTHDPEDASYTPPTIDPRRRQGSVAV